MPNFVPNLVHFTRLLRRAGLGVGPDRALAAVAALQAVGVQRRTDVHAALSAVMLDRHEQQPLFDAAFDEFWREPQWLALALAAQGEPTGARQQPVQQPTHQRLAQALAESADSKRAAEPKAPKGPKAQEPPSAEQQDTPALLSSSGRERLHHADFDSMSTEEFAQALHLARRVPLPVQPVQRRRHETAARGRPNLRATLQRQMRQPHTLVPAFTRPRRETPAVVVLLDISGSMERYARLFLHYAHGLMQRRLKVSVFTFGTRLTPITRSLAQRDPDLALAHVAEQVKDWNGGTRIASSLNEFNRRWARRVLGGNAALLLVTDGLDRDEPGAHGAHGVHGDLGRAGAQLKRLAHEVVWLNPLLRFARFEPKAAGMRALLPHVDRFLPVHNLDSLADLAAALKRPTVAPTLRWK